MYFEVFKGLMLPFLGTAVGAACVFFIKKDFKKWLKVAISGFAAGVMIAASVWSLLIPAMEYESSLALGSLSFLPALFGLWVGVVFMLLIDRFIPEFNFTEGNLSALGESKMLLLSVFIHNIPEGMAVGVAYAAYLSCASPDSLSGALALALGIAIQNIPEGAIISTPLASNGMKKAKAFFYGIISGIVEPIGAFLTVLALSLVLPVLPILLGFAAGAMIYAVIKELLPIISEDRSSYAGVIFFAMGFSVMMMLDVALG